jgi:hypothetical protein
VIWNYFALFGNFTTNKDRSDMGLNDVTWPKVCYPEEKGQNTVSVADHRVARKQQGCHSLFGPGQFGKNGSNQASLNYNSGN